MYIKHVSLEQTSINQSTFENILEKSVLRYIQEISRAQIHYCRLLTVPTYTTTLSRKR